MIHEHDPTVEPVKYGDGARNEVNYVSWFDVIIEGENYRGRLEFGFKDKDFPKTFDSYFHTFGEMCTSQSHKCRGRVGCLICPFLSQIISASISSGHL